MILLNDKKINVLEFNDRTDQVWKLENLKEDINLITLIWDTDNSNAQIDLLHLLQLSTLIDAIYPNSYKKLNIPFLCFARQDKSISNESTFALHAIAKLINACNFNLITSFDTHSDVAKDLIKNLEVINALEFQDDAYNQFGADMVFYADEGALKRYKGNSRFSIFGRKVRESSTGEITSFEVVNNDISPVKNKKVLIVDDLADNGGTFILAAKALYALGANEVGLAVSHGIFANGFQTLMKAGITNFYMTNSLVKNSDFGYKVWE